MFIVPTELVELVAEQHGWQLLQMIVCEGSHYRIEKFEAVLAPRGIKWLCMVAMRIIAGFFALVMSVAVLDQVWRRTFEMSALMGAVIFIGGFAFTAALPLRRKLTITRIREKRWSVESETISISGDDLHGMLKRALDESEHKSN